MSLARRHRERILAAQAAAADGAAVTPAAAAPLIGVDFGAPAGDRTEVVIVDGGHGSLARRHRQRVMAGVLTLAANDNGPASADQGPRASEYEQLLLQLAEDRRRLKALQSIEAKIELKRELLPKYDAWIEGTLESALLTGRGVQDEVVVTCLMWRIDTGDWAQALKLAFYVLQFGLQLPGHVNRTPATFVVEEISDAALADKPTPYEVLIQLELLARDRDMPDQVRAKLHKALGLALLRAADATDEDAASAVAGGRRARLEGAHAHLTRALALNAKAGVKKEIERLERELKKPAAGDTDQTGASPES